MPSWAGVRKCTKSSLIHDECSDKTECPMCGLTNPNLTPRKTQGVICIDDTPPSTSTIIDSNPRVQAREHGHVLASNHRNAAIAQTAVARRNMATAGSIPLSLRSREEKPIAISRVKIEIRAIVVQVDCNGDWNGYPVTTLFSKVAIANEHQPIPAAKSRFGGPRILDFLIDLLDEAEKLRFENAQEKNQVLLAAPILNSETAVATAFINRQLDDFKDLSEFISLLPTKNSKPPTYMLVVRINEVSPEESTSTILDGNHHTPTTSLSRAALRTRRVGKAAAVKTEKAQPAGKYTPMIKEETKVKGKVVKKEAVKEEVVKEEDNRSLARKRSRSKVSPQVKEVNKKPTTSDSSFLQTLDLTESPAGDGFESLPEESEDLIEDEVLETPLSTRRSHRERRPKRFGDM